MTKPTSDDQLLDQHHRRALSRYSQTLAERVAAQAFGYEPGPASPKVAEPIAELMRLARLPGQVAERLDRISTDAAKAWHMLAQGPGIWLRWHQAITLLQIAGVESPYLRLQELLSEGLLVLWWHHSTRDIERLDVPSDLPTERMPLVTALGQALDAEAETVPLVFPDAVDDNDLPNVASLTWRKADGWEWPLRLAVLWRMAAESSFKRTQQDDLFKKDADRLAQNALLNAPLMDAATDLESIGLLTYELALSLGLLKTDPSDQGSAGPLPELWPDQLDHLLLDAGRWLIGVESWNELGSQAAIGAFSQSMPSARFLLMLALVHQSQQNDRPISLSTLADWLLKIHPTWNGLGEPIGVLRRPGDRTKLGRQWVRQTLLGPLYQAGFVEFAQLPLLGFDEEFDDQAPDDLHRFAVRATPLAQRLFGRSVEIEPGPEFPQTLLAQPNHDVVVYRQGLNLPLLADLSSFADFASLGAAVTLRLSAESIYHGLENGISADQIIEVLESNGGRQLPQGLEGTIRTWAQRRDRVTVHASGLLLEFSSPEDREAAIERGLQGIPIGEQMMLAEESDTSLTPFRLTASRDYHLPSGQCVEMADNGYILRVDPAKADLMLESEILRFAEAMRVADRQGRRQFRATAESIRKAFDKGLNVEFIEQWFQQRTGSSPPPSMYVLFRAARHAPVPATRQMVIELDDARLADGFLQHPATRELFTGRPGPQTLTFPESSLPDLQEAFEKIGLTLNVTEFQPQSAPESE